MFSDQKFSSSILANSFSLKGSISCKGELQIDGRINGNLNGEKVILGPESVMDGTLTADEIIISGKFKGKIKGKIGTFSFNNKKIIQDLNIYKAENNQFKKF